MEQLPNGFTLNLPEGAFPLSTDSMVLSHFVRLPKNARVLDLGSGCGTLGLLLCAVNESCRVTGVELSQSAHLAAIDNIRRNGLTTRMESICVDVRQVPGSFPPGSFDVCVSNPPYFSGGPASRTAARKNGDVHTKIPPNAFGYPMQSLLEPLYPFVHRPERLAELIVRGSQVNLEAKRLCLVRHQADSPVNLVLLQLRKGGKPGLKWEEIVLHDLSGAPTEQYRRIYHL